MVTYNMRGPSETGGRTMSPRALLPPPQPDPARSPHKSTKIVTDPNSPHADLLSPGLDLLQIARDGKNPGGQMVQGEKGFAVDLGESPSSPNSFLHQQPQAQDDVNAQPPSRHRSIVQPQTSTIEEAQSGQHSIEIKEPKTSHISIQPERAEAIQIPNSEQHSLATTEEEIQKSRIPASLKMKWVHQEKGGAREPCSPHRSLSRIQGDNQQLARMERRHGQVSLHQAQLTGIDDHITGQHSRTEAERKAYSSRYPATQKDNGIQEEDGGDLQFSSPLRGPRWQWTDIQKLLKKPRCAPEELNREQRLRLPNRSAFIPTIPNEDASGWIQVKPKRWWRKSRTDPIPQDYSVQSFHRLRGSAFFKQKLRGRCFNCFAPDHIAGFCVESVKCWRCLHSGHRAVQCSSRGSNHWDRVSDSRNPTHQSHLPSVPPHAFQTPHSSELLPKNIPSATTKTYSQAVQQGCSMEARYPGDPRARPARAYCAISATGAIKRRRDELIDHAAVCWFDGNSHEVESYKVGDLLRDRFNLGHGDFQLVKHYPEQFLIIFSESAMRRRVVSTAVVPYRGHVFNFAAWSEQRYATNVNFEFHVKIRVEGVPIHCWSEEVAARALGSSCAVHYVQERTRRRERTRSFDLWAWCSDPCKIPKEVTLTVLEPDRELPPINVPLPQVAAHYDDPTDLKRGQVFNLRNHLEIVEDLSFLRGRGSIGGLPNRKPRREFVWNYGAPDDMGERRDGAAQDSTRRRDQHRRRDDHDDEDRNRNDHRRSTRRHRSLSNWARDSRCRGVEDCHSASWRGPGGSASRRYRRDSALPHQMLVQTPKKSGLTERKVQDKSKKKVTFAEPIVTVLKTLQGGHSTDNTELGKREKESSSTTCAQLGLQLAMHFDRPLSKEKVEAILELVNQGILKKSNRKNLATGVSATSTEISLKD